MYAQTWKKIYKVFDKVEVATSTTVGLKLNHASIRTCFTKSLPVGWSHFSVRCKENTQIDHYWLSQGKRILSLILPHKAFEG